MEIFFVIDSLDNIEHKISLLESFGDNIKFFVDAKFVPKILGNKYIIARVVSIYNKNVNVTIDKYIKSSRYQVQNTLLYYASAELDLNIVEDIRERLKAKPDVIYVKKKLNAWKRFKLWFYQKFTKFIFGVADEYASIKLQYFSAEMMGALMETSFKNHIFSIPEAHTITLDEKKAETYYTKPKFNKHLLYNPIAMCIILMGYVVLEKFFKLQFWMYLFVVLSIITVIACWCVMTIKNKFDTRYKK